MKKTIIYIGLAVSVSLFAACSDLLDTNPKDFLSIESYYKTEDDVINSLGAIYSVLGSQNTYGRYLVIDGAMDDLCYWNQSEADIINRLCSWNYTPAQPHLANLWNSLYEGIERSNVLLENIGKVDGLEETARNKYIGETRFLRAYYHYLLADNWGAVPLKMVSSKKVSEVNIAPTSQKEIFQTVVEEIEDILEKDMLNPADSYNHVSRVSTTVAQGILARIYLKMAGYPLYMGEDMYEKALYWAQQVELSHLHMLNRDYDQIFINHSQDIQDVQYRESMWEANFVGNSTTDPGKSDKYSWIGVTNGIICYSDKDDLGYSYGYIRTRLKLWDLFDDTDKRKMRSIAPYKFNTTDVNKYDEKTTSFTSIAERCAAKWRREEESVKPKTKNYSTTNFPILRYSDVLLMIAEAENELHGATDVALAALNQVRERAGVKCYTTGTTDDTKITVTGADELRQIIRDERAQELCFEGIRKHDLIRWGIYVQEMQKAAAEPYETGNVGNGRTSDANQRTKMAAIASKMTEKYLLFPIPQSELNLNNKMKQNKYW